MSKGKNWRRRCLCLATVAGLVMLSARWVPAAGGEHVAGKGGKATGTAEKKVPIKGVSHVTIMVSDMDRSIAFYRDVLGWKKVFDVPIDPAALAEVSKTMGGAPNPTGRACGGHIGGLGVELVWMSDVPTTPRPRGLGLAQLSLEVAHVQAVRERLQALGVPMLTPIVEFPHSRGFTALDPDGQAIEFVEYLPGGKW